MQHIFYLNVNELLILSISMTLTDLLMRNWGCRKSHFERGKARGTTSPFKVQSSNVESTLGVWRHFTVCMVG